jgi:putative two-component system response regulator
MTRYAHVARILVVDDEPGNTALVSRLMKGLGYEVATATNGEAALEAVRRVPPDVILLDVNMPLLDGFEVCRRLKHDVATRLIPVVLLTGLAAVEDRVRGIDAGADDFLTKPFVVAELKARVRSLARLKRYTDELDSADAVILSLARTIEARDPYTSGHCERLARYATALGAHLGFGDDQLVALHRGGFLHDVGKIGIPDAVLLKRGPLDPADVLLIQEHPVIGDRLCGELRLLDEVRPIVMTPDQARDELREDVARGWKSATLVEEFVAIARRADPEPSVGSSSGRLQAFDLWTDDPTVPHADAPGTVFEVDDEAPIRRIGPGDVPSPEDWVSA